MTTWLFDLGNTRLKFAPLDEGGRIGEVIVAPHDGDGFVGDWLAGLPTRIASAHVASVASPALRVALLDALSRRASRISLASSQRAWAGVQVAYAEPSRLGVDRFLAMLAARARYRQACLLAGVGTALTIDLLDAAGRHHGGRIAPSPMLMRAVLHQRAAQLPESGGVYREFADNTEDALASGAIGAAVALVERSLDQAAQRLGGMPRLLLHGGGSEVLLPHFNQAGHAPSLVLEGLARWAMTDSD